MKIRIQNVRLLCLDAENHFFSDGVVCIADGEICFAGNASEAPAFEAERTIEGRGRLCMPGLVNAHTHNAMTLMRGAGSDLRLQEWLESAMFPVEAKLTEEDLIAGNRLAIAELLRFGVTSFCDMYVYTDAVVDAIAKTGIRAKLTPGITGESITQPRMQEKLAITQRWMERETPRLRFQFGPHAEYTTTPELLRALRALGQERGFHIHCAETLAEVEGCFTRHGMSPVAYFESLGLLGEKTLLAHCVHLSPTDIAILRDTGTHVAHCPVSNLKLASGIAPISQLLDSGVPVCLGTDGAASNNSLNLFEEVKLAPLLQKGVLKDPLRLPVYSTLRMATQSGAKALGWENIGKLEAGYRADLILLDMDGAHAQPVHDWATHVVYSAQGSDVSLTMVDGTVLYEDGEYTTLDKEAVARDARAAVERLYTEE